MSDGSILPLELSATTELLPEDSGAAIASDLAAIARIDAVPKLLEILCNVTGMRFAAVARVTDGTWTACAVQDRLNFGLMPGGQLDLHTTLCVESRAARAPIVIEAASKDPRYCGHHTPKIYNIESYVSVPIVLPGGRYFGNLCAIDSLPAPVSDTRTMAIFTGFAQLIASQLGYELDREKDRTALQDERAAVELRDQFIAILGHDLRNPLQAIDGTSVLIERKAMNPAIATMAARIRANVRRMSALIDDVLDFARGRLGGGMGVTISQVDDVETALRGVVEEIQDARPDRKIVLDVNVARPVHCDVARIEQVLSNLMGNALTHGSPNGVIDVTIGHTDHELVIEVANDGEPIAPESIGKIFEPFWRQSTSGNRQGLGLGLHICSQIVRGHGGRITVKSTRDSGTRFSVYLPLERPVKSAG